MDCFIICDADEINFPEEQKEKKRTSNYITTFSFNGKIRAELTLKHFVWLVGTFSIFSKFIFHPNILLRFLLCEIRAIFCLFLQTFWKYA